MVEKMTAVWLIILTVMVCSSVPALLIWLTASPATMLLGLEESALLREFVLTH